MRLLGLAVLALVLIGTVLTLGQLGAFNTNVGALLARDALPVVVYSHPCALLKNQSWSPGLVTYENIAKFQY